MKVYNGLKIIKKALDTLVNAIVTLLILSLIVVVCVQVFSRYVLNDPKSWTEELARYLFVWLVFLTSSVVFRENRHLSIDFFVSLVPEKLQKAIAVGVNLLITAFIIIALYHSQRLLMITSFQTSPTLMLKMSWIYLSFPLSLGLILIELMFRFVFAMLEKFCGPQTIQAGPSGNSPVSEGR